MFELNSINDWKNLYVNDYLQKFECLQKVLKTDNFSDIEYWFVLTLSSLFNVLRQYFASKELMYFKTQDIINHSFNDGILLNKSKWLEAYTLSNRIGRAVRAKEENIDKIKDYIPIFQDFEKTIETLIRNNEKRDKNDS